MLKQGVVYLIYLLGLVIGFQALAKDTHTHLELRTNTFTSDQKSHVYKNTSIYIYVIDGKTTVSFDQGERFTGVISPIFYEHSLNVSSDQAPESEISQLKIKLLELGILDLKGS